MRSVFSAAAAATLLSGASAAPSSIPGISFITDIINGVGSGVASGIPTDPKGLAAWASARGLAYDPSYKHVSLPNEVVNPQHVLAGVSSILGNVTSHIGSLPSIPGLSARINGPDDRYQYTNPNAYPWRAVGKVQWSNGVSCTGQMIGPRHVLTAKHCIPQDGQQVSISFSPSYDRGANPTFGVGQVQTAIYNGAKPGGDCNMKIDAAIMIIDKRFGDGLGYFGADIPNTGGFNQKIFTTLGYPGDRDSAQRPYRMDGSQLPSPGRVEQLNCDKKTGPIFSDTDVAPGQSGSALWRDGGVVWGVCSVVINWSDGYSMGGWASGDDLINMINYARGNWN